MSKVRTRHECIGCGQQVAQWVGRCPGCSAWGTIEASQAPASTGTGLAAATASQVLGTPDREARRISTGSEGIDRVLGGGIVPGSVILLAGEPGIGKSTLLLDLLSHMSVSGLSCLLASGEESRSQVAARAVRLGVAPDAVRFTPGRDLGQVVGAALAERPAVLAVDSIQTLRDTDATTATGGVSQVRGCTDVLVGLAKELEITVILTGHVTKDGDLAGPRTLEHAVDVVLAFEGDPHSGQRVLAGGKNRFGQEGELVWFEMGPAGLTEVDPGSSLVSSLGDPGSALALPLAGRLALAVEVQALVVPTEGSARRYVAGLDAKRFQLVAAVVDRHAGISLSKAELYGAVSGGLKIADPGCDLAIAAALASAATGRQPPEGTAFVGEVGLTGRIRSVSGVEQRVAASRGRGVKRVIGPGASDALAGVQGVRTISQALSWAIPSTRS